MAPGELDVQELKQGFSSDDAIRGIDGLGLGAGTSSNGSSEAYDCHKKEELCNHDSSDMQITNFTEVLDDATLHFQIIRLHKQIFAWIGCNSARFGHLYAAAPTRPSNTVGVTSILGGVPDSTGSGIARRLVSRTGLNVILACNIPKNSAMLEAVAERKLVETLINLGYVKPKSQVLSR